MDKLKKQHNKSNRKKLIWTVALLAVASIAFLLIDPITGNPISKLLVKSMAKAYIAEQYPALDLQLERVGYNFKDGCYYAHVATADNVDIHFAVAADGWGHLLSDDYDSRVASGWNTAMRLDGEYRTLTEAGLAADGFPYTCDIGFGELLFDEFSIPTGSNNYLNMADLELGKEYDIVALAKKYGKLTIYIDHDTVTLEEAANVLLGLKTWMDEMGVPFYSIDFTLQYPRAQDESARPDGTVMALDFLYTDIYQEGMAARVRAAHEAALAYYNEQDAYKAAEPTE